MLHGAAGLSFALVYCALLEPAAAASGTIYAQGDLILVNPQQSTAIFVSVLVFSTAFEYILEWLSNLRNRYQHSIVLAIKEEVTCMAVGELLLLWVAFSIPLSSQWKAVLQFVALCLIYMALGYCIAVTVITVLTSRMMKFWRLFEWARLGADATHSRDQQVLKMCRQFYFSMLPFEVDASDAAGDVDDTDQNPNAMILFTSMMTLVERKHMKAFTDFTPLTWLGLFFVVTVNGFRALIVSTTGSDDSTKIAQSLSFIALCGWGSLGIFFLASSVLVHRPKKWLFAQAADNGGNISKVKRTDQQREADIDIFTKKLFVGSVPNTMQVFKMVLLVQLWYLSLMIVGIDYVIFRDLGWYSLLVYPVSLAPPLLTVTLYPAVIARTLMIAVLGAEFDPDVARQVLEGEIDVNDVELTDEEMNAGGDLEEELVDKGEKILAEQRSRTNAADDDIDLPDEWQGAGITLHQSTTVVGAPSKVMGVRPVLNDRSWVVSSRRPVFDDTALLRRNAVSQL